MRGLRVNVCAALALAIATIACRDSTAPPSPMAQQAVAATEPRASVFGQYSTSYPEPSSRDQFEGLPDRSRPAPRIDEEGVPHYPALRVDRLYIGNGILLRAGQGTVYADGRLEILGQGENSAEIAMWPGPRRHGRGIAAQILMYSLAHLEPGQRTGWSIVDDGTGKYVMRDSDAFGSSPVMPVYDAVGGRTNANGEDDGGFHVATSMFGNKSDEIWLSGGRRVNIRHVIEAVLRRYPDEIFCRRPPEYPESCPR